MVHTMKGNDDKFDKITTYCLSEFLMAKNHDRPGKLITWLLWRNNVGNGQKNSFQRWVDTCLSMQQTGNEAMKWNPLEIQNLYQCDCNGVLTWQCRVDEASQCFVPTLIHNQIMYSLHYTKFGRDSTKIWVYNTMRHHYLWPPIASCVYRTFWQFCSCVREKVQPWGQCELRLFTRAGTMDFLVTIALRPPPNMNDKCGFIVTTSYRLQKLTKVSLTAKTDKSEFYNQNLQENKLRPYSVIIGSFGRAYSRICWENADHTL